MQKAANILIAVIEKQLRGSEMGRYTELEEKQMEEIERLRKENEWLLQKAIYDYHSKRTPQPPAGEAEENILKEMQQALKEE